MGSTQLSSALLRHVLRKLSVAFQLLRTRPKQQQGTCWRAGGGSLVPWQECAECRPKSPAWREGAVTVPATLRKQLRQPSRRWSQ